MRKKSDIGAVRLISAFRNSIAGLAAIWKRDSSFRAEVIVLFASIPASFLVGSSLMQIGFLIGSILCVIIVEIINTSLEVVVDRIGLEEHELSRVAKDLGSLAVLLSMLFPLVIWVSAVLGFLGYLH